MAKSYTRFTAERRREKAVVAEKTRRRGIGRKVAKTKLYETE